MKIFVRTTGERSIEQFKDLDYEVLMDSNKTGCSGYFKQLKYLETIDDDILLLEDDIRLRPNFWKCLEDLIEISKNKYIIDMSYPTSSVGLFEARLFVWTRAVYYPKGSISKFMKNYTEDKLEVSMYYDKIQRTLMKGKFIGCPSVMTIIDLKCKSLMDYGKNK